MTNKNVQHIQISTWTMIRFFLVTLGIAALYFLKDVVAALIFAVIIASAIEPAIEWMKKYKLPRILAVILIYLCIAAFIAFVVYLVFPLLFEEFQNVYATYPAIQKKILLELKHQDAVPLELFLSGGGIEKFLKVPSEYLAQLSGGIVDFASVAFGGVFTFVIITVFSFYLAAQEKGIESFLRLVTPLSQESYILDLWRRAQRKLGRWMRAQLLLGAIVGVLIFLGLTFMGIRQALFFALVAGMFEIIPVVGPILAAIPAVIMAFLVSPFLGLSTVALYIVVQQVESHVIVPVVMQKAIGLSPLVVVLALLIGGKLGGIFGILLAVPITAIVAEFVNDWDKKKRALIPE